MRVLLINSVCGVGSTGRICAELAQAFEKDGHEAKIAYGRDGYVPEAYQKYAVRIGTDWDVKLHGLRTRLFDDHGFGSAQATKRFLQWADAYDPDLLWLHNLHGYYINVKLLFDWIRSRPKMQVKWTLHDCWAFTGHCAHFDFAGCSKWKEGCSRCIQRRRYPASLIDGSKRNWERKKSLFTQCSGIELITPSEWLAGVVRQSFFGQYSVRVMPNGIDTRVFRPTGGLNLAEYGLKGKRIILGVASNWAEPQKGLPVFLELADCIDSAWQIVLIGGDEAQRKSLPPQITGIPRTHDARELAQWYSAADVFVNPSCEETMGMTTLEALACGTPAIVNRRTALPEVIDETCGVALDDCSARSVWQAVQACRFAQSACVERAQRYDKETVYAQALAPWRGR